ncbi:fibronectin type III domain-containing protein, partial [Runella zeae]|uniref:fibronectin type III domain-containing protein n=1 Tax=Runella zeae TaxID=94255 RepID=UPI0012FC4BE8
MNLRLPISYTTAFLSKVSILSKVTLFVFVLGFSWGLQAQTTDNYPVQTTAYCAAPFSQRLSDYFSSDKRLIVNLLLKDLTKPSVQVYLRWQLEGPGIRIGSRDGFVPASFISLQPGVPSKLSGADLAGAYFFPAALQAEGMDVVDAYNLSLPEGFYTISVQAFEASTGQVVSNTSVTFLVLTSPQPPILNLPAIGSQISATSLQKVVFQWTPRHFATAESQVVYQLKVCQVPDDSEPNEQIMLSCTEPRLELTVPNTTLTGDITQWIKPLEVGQRYGVQVRAIDLAGQLNNFSNEGYSQVNWFRYGQPCVAPIFSIKSVSSDRVQLQWQALAQAQSYLVEYQAEGDVSWTTLKTTATTQVVSELLSRQTYLFRMRTDCGSLVPSEASEVQRWNIAEEAPEPSPQLPIELLNPELIKVQTSGGVAQTPTSLPDLYHNFPVSNSAQLRIAAFSAPTTTTLQIPDCALASGSFADCQRPHPSVGLPTGGEELGSLKVGDVLGIYDFAVFVTKVKSGPGLAGEGLVRLPFLGNAMTLVEFEGVKAKKAQPSDNGGCVYEVSGFFRVKANVTAQELAQQQQSLVERLLKESDPTVFAGTFEQALTLYDQTVAKLGTQSLTSVQAQPLLIQYLGAILQGSEQLKQQLSELGSSNPAVVTLLGDLQKLMDGLQSQLTTLKTTTQTPTVAGLEVQYEAIFERIKQLGHTPEVPIETPQSGQLSNVEVSKVSFNSAHLSWQGSGNIKRYAVVYQIPTLGELTLNTTDSQVELSNLQAGSNYTFRVIGYGADGQVLDSYGPALFATPAKTLPAPENLTYTVLDDHSVKISWAKNSLHQRFKLSYQDANGETRTLYPSTNSATITGLDLSQNYNYDIVAYNNEQLASEAAIGNILSTFCLLSIKAEKSTIYQNETVSLIAFGCQPQYITWSNGQKGTNIIIVSPLQTHVYFAVCEVPGKRACSNFVEIKVADDKCKMFTIEASETEVAPGMAVTLTAQGCRGQITWDKNLGTKPAISVSLVKNMEFTATCAMGSSICEKTIQVKVKCDIILKVFPEYKGGFLGLTSDKKITIRGFCTHSPLFINGNEFKEGEGSVEFDGDRDLSVIATCGEGENACSKTLEVKAVSRKCKDFWVGGWEEKAGFLTLTAYGCSEGNTVRWDNGMEGSKIIIPVPSQATIYKGTCGKNGCEAYYTYTDNLENEYFSIEVGNEGRYPRTLTPRGCSGEVRWESNPATSLNIELNTRYPSITIEKQPLQTTTYIATCRATSNEIVQKTYQIQVAPACISIRGPAVAAKGESVTLSAIGCLGNAVWKSSKGNLLSQSVTITEIALEKVDYEVSCDRPLCKAKHSVEIKPCAFVVTAPKNILKAGEEAILTAEGCLNGTVLWRDQAQALIGWGTQLSIRPLKTQTIKAICDVSQCESSIKIEVPASKINPIICETLTLSASPSTPILSGEPNTVTLTASGCTGGVVLWKGPLLEENTQTSYPNHQITITNLQQAATYTASCSKVALPSTEASITIKAEIRFTLKATPQAVESGKTTTLTAEGCIGGQISWTKPSVPCQGTPCTITSPAITSPTTFQANCLIEGKTIARSINIYLKNSYGSEIYQQICSDFWASYSANIQLPYPIPSGSKITLQAGGCDKGTIKWTARDGQGIVRTLKALEDAPTTSTTYIATCETSGTICAQKQFLVDVHEFSCESFGLLVESQSPTGQLGGAKTGEISFVVTYSGTAHRITATGCINKEVPGAEELKASYYPLPNSSSQAVSNNTSFYPQQGSKIEISCKPSIAYPNEICKYTVYFDSKGIRTENNSNARIGDTTTSGELSQTSSETTTTVSGCTAALPLKSLMADYFTTLLCANINAFYDEYGQFSREKAAIFLTATETQLRNNSYFKSYKLDFPADYTDIIDQIEALDGDCEGMTDIAKALTEGLKETMFVDSYNEAASNSYSAIENAARDALTADDGGQEQLLKQIKLSTDATSTKCIPLAVLIYALKSTILYKQNLHLYDLPANCLTLEESNVIVNPAINELTLPQVKAQFSTSFQST